MQVHKETAAGFLGQPKLSSVVPVYQRNYNWLGSQCRKLFDDLAASVAMGTRHFIGTVCYKTDSSKKRQIVDGQQRITSLSLLLAAMCDISADDMDEISETYLVNKYADNDFDSLKLHLNKADDEVYRLVVRHGAEAEDKLDIRQRRSRVWQNYNLFLEWSREYAVHGGSVRALLDGFDLLTLVELEIEQENPQEIFESLNSTGLDLTPVDLLRNYLLMRFGHAFQTELYEKYWSVMEYAVGPENMPLFFTDYIRTKLRSHVVYGINGQKRAPISEKRLQFFFKHYYDSLEGFDTEEGKAEAVFSDMARYAKLYKVLLFQDDDVPEDMDPIRRLAYFLIVVNECSTSRVLLLYLLDLQDRSLIDGSQMMEALEAVTSFVFRSKVCRYQGLKAQFVTSILLRLKSLVAYDNFMDTFWRALTSGEKSFEFPSDGAFRACLVGKDLFINTLRPKGLKYMLYTLDLHSGYGKGMPLYNDETITVDHVMPQTPTAEWYADMDGQTKDRHGELKHRLGNMALTSQNSEMSNKLFDARREFYRNAKFHYTQELADCVSWGVDEIEARGRRLADEACRVWPLPDRYMKHSASDGAGYTLSDDLGWFTSKKLSSAMVGCDPLDASSWADLFCAVAKYLNAEDPEAMVKAVMAAGPGTALFDDGDGLAHANRYMVQADGSLYVRGHQSAKGTLSSIRRLVVQYDDAAGTDHMGDILFWVK